MFFLVLLLHKRRERMGYLRVFFRIDTPLYSVGVTPLNTGFISPVEKKNFESEAINIFKDLGFDVYTFAEEYMIGEATTMVRYPEWMYLHPQSFSGYLREGSIQEVESSLEKASFLLRKVDIYEKVDYFSPEEYSNKLEEKRGEITQEMLERFSSYREKTPVFREIGGILPQFLPPVETEKRLALERVRHLFIVEIFKDLLLQDRLISTKNGKYRARRGKQCF